MHLECEHAPIPGKKNESVWSSRNGDIQLFSLSSYLWDTLYSFNRSQNLFRRLLLIFNQIITDFEDFNRFQ